MVTVAGDGRSAGAVYTPLVVMVPSAALPPGTPFTVQLTAVSVVLLTLALNDVVFPKITDPLFGVTVTWVCAGGGGGGAAVPPPPPHPTSAITIPMPIP